MTKITKDELKQKISEKITDTDLAIEFLEDIDDSMEITDTKELDQTKAEVERLKNELSDMKDKYKARFTESIMVTEKAPEVNETLKEANVVDVKDIFY